MTSISIALALALAFQVSVAIGYRATGYRARVREGSPIALAASLARDRDMARDLEGMKLAPATSREELALEGQDTPYEVGQFCQGCTKHRVFSRKN